MEATVEPCIQTYRSKSRTNAELEVRLGTYSDGVFSAGVSKDVFEQIERDMTDSTSLTPEAQWSEIVDYYYCHDARTIRSRVEYDTVEMKMTTTHIEKETIHSMIISRDDDPHEACRLTMCMEHPITDPPPCSIITYVRVKQRRRFTDVRDGNVVWNFELSKTWSANTREGVEVQQHMSEPSYEIECELQDSHGTYMAARSDREVAESLMLKIKLLLGEEVSGKVSVLDTKQHTRRRRGRR